MIAFSSMFSQLLKLFPRTEFDVLVKGTHTERDWHVSQASACVHLPTPQTAVRPPSMTIEVPVMNDDSSDAKKTTVAATSSGRPNRLNGVVVSSDCFQGAGKVAVIGVSMRPGCTQFTRMLSGAYWTAAAFESISTPPFALW